MQATVNNLTFGWMTETDAKFLLITMKLVAKSFEGVINSLEVGVRDGTTSRAIYRFFTDNNRICFHTGIDSGQDGFTESPFDECRFIQGNSMEVFNQVPLNSQHFIFLDGNHSYPMALIDFLVYSERLVMGGYIVCHDTSPHILPFTDYQHIGDRGDHAMYISVRQALNRLGLYENRFHGFKPIYDVSDPSAPTGGVSVFKRIA